MESSYDLSNQEDLDEILEVYETLEDEVVAKLIRQSKSKKSKDEKRVMAERKYQQIKKNPKEMLKYVKEFATPVTKKEAQQYLEEATPKKTIPQMEDEETRADYDAEAEAELEAEAEAEAQEWKKGTIEYYEKKIQDYLRDLDGGIVSYQEVSDKISDYDDMIEQLKQGNRFVTIKNRSKEPFKVLLKAIELNKAGKLTQQEFGEIELNVKDLMTAKEDPETGFYALPSKRQIKEKVKDLITQMMEKKYGLDRKTKFKGRTMSTKEKLTKLKKLDKVLPKGSGADVLSIPKGEPSQLPTMGSGKSTWINQVKAVQAELGCSYKDAMKEASKRRKSGDSQMVGGPSTIPEWVKKGISNEEYLKRQKN